MPSAHLSWPLFVVSDRLGKHQRTTFLPQCFETHCACKAPIEMHVDRFLQPRETSRLAASKIVAASSSPFPRSLQECRYLQYDAMISHEIYRRGALDLSLHHSRGVGSREHHPMNIKGRSKFSHQLPCFQGVVL